MDLNRADSTRSRRSVRVSMPPPARPGMSRQLSRIDSERENPQNMKVFEDRFVQMPFADPKKQRAYPLGPLVHTEEHVLLLRRLRSEAARLSADLATCRNKLAILKAERGVLEGQLNKSTADNRRLRARLEESTHALFAAQKAFAEFDNLYAQNKRRTKELAELETDYLNVRDTEGSHPARPNSYRA